MCLALACRQSGTPPPPISESVPVASAVSRRVACRVDSASHPVHQLIHVPDLEFRDGSGYLPMVALGPV